MENNVDLSTLFVKCEDKVEKQPQVTKSGRPKDSDRAAVLFGFEKGAFDEKEEE